MPGSNEYFQVARVIILDGHPHDDPRHFVHALADAYATGANGRHQTRRIDIAKLDFPLLRDPADWREGNVPDGLREAQEALGWASHLVMLYPLWLGDMPALLKAFLEQVARPGLAVQPKDSGVYEKLLIGKSSRLIVAMGIPALAYELFFRAHSVKAFKRNILKFVGPKPVRFSIGGNVEGSARHRTRWLVKVERLGRAGGWRSAHLR